MYIRPSQPETPRLHNGNKTLYLATIGHETDQHSTSSLHAAFRLLLTLPISPARAPPVGDSTILADVICPTWPGTLSLFPRVKRTAPIVLAQQGWASLRSSKYVGVHCPATIQCFVWLAIPSSWQPVKADYSSIAQNVLALAELRSCTVLY